MPQVYQGTKVTISYDERICVHAGTCVKTLPTVFDVSRKPWIDPDQAAPENIRETVAKCPSGALKMAAR